MRTIASEPINFVQINRFLESAARKLRKAEVILRIDEQMGFQAAYDAMFRASLGFMLSCGKRPRSTIGHHKAVIDFVGAQLGPHYQTLMRGFDRMRRKRNEALYEPLSTITEKEAHDAISTARKYIKVMSGEMHRRNPQQKLAI